MFTLVNTKSNLIKGIDYFQGDLTIDFDSKMITYSNVPEEVAMKANKLHPMTFYLKHIQNAYDYKVLQDRDYSEMVECIDSTEEVM